MNEHHKHLFMNLGAVLMSRYVTLSVSKDYKDLYPKYNEVVEKSKEVINLIEEILDEVDIKDAERLSYKIESWRESSKDIQSMIDVIKTRL